MKNSENTIQLKLNQDLGGKKKGTILTLKVDREKTILDRYWRRRFKDSVLDNCVELVTSELKELADEVLKRRQSKKEKGDKL